jgi:hypothetical protein
MERRVERGLAREHRHSVGNSDPAKVLDHDAPKKVSALGSSACKILHSLRWQSCADPIISSVLASILIERRTGGWLN